MRESSPQTTANRCLMLSLSSNTYEMLVDGTAMRMSFSRSSLVALLSQVAV